MGRRGTLMRTGGYAGINRKRSRYERKTIDLPALVSGVQSGDVSVNMTSVIAGGSQKLLNGVAQGTDMYTRIGRKITIKSIQIKGIAESLIFAGSAPDITVSQFQSSCIGRIVIFVDMQSNATAPGAFDVLQNSTVGGNSMMNLNNRDRFKILANYSFPLGPIFLQSNATNYISQTVSNPSFVVDFYKKCNIEVIFNGGTAGTIGDITTGAIYLLAATDQPTTGSITPGTWVFNFQSRIRFEDL